MTYGGSEFIKMIQKNKKRICIFFTCVGWGGQDKPAWTACPPDVKINRVGGGQNIQGQLAPPQGASQRASGPGGKINWDTGAPKIHKATKRAFNAGPSNDISLAGR